MLPPHPSSQDGARACASAMCSLSNLNQRSRRRVMVFAYICALVVVLLLWPYLYRSRYPHRGFRHPPSRFDPLLPVSNTPEDDTKTDEKTSPTDMTDVQKPLPPADGPTVILPQGIYIGTRLRKSGRFPKSVDAFRGVPYAQDTSGENRFRPPQPLPQSNETFGAVEWGKICPTHGEVQSNMSEDCLSANIYRPSGLVDRDGYIDEEGTWIMKKRAKLPVAVYVHGGGFNFGHGTERNMASFLAWNEEPMVTVNFNYRVGALGFLPSDVTAREGLLNLGLRDQQMMLQWVKDNIQAFGGDPDNITVMGLSAGAHSIGHHIMHYSQSSTPAPFHKAILESGATTARAVFYPTHTRHLIQFREFLIAVGAAGIPESDIFDHLRTLPVETIVRASKVVWDKYSDDVTWPFQPVIDGPHPLANSSHLSSLPPIIPTLPIASWRAAHHLRIPIITGYSTHEGTRFIPEYKDDTPEDFRYFFQTLIPSFTEADLDKLEALYPDPIANPDDSPYVEVPKYKGRQWSRMSAAYSHYAYICPVFQTAHFMSENQQSNNNNVYVYRYAATSTWGTANHGDEAAVVVHDMEELGLGEGQQGKRDGLLEVAEEMCAMWGRFVVGKVGDPNPPPGEDDDDADEGEEGEEKKRKSINWPAFVSPFSGWKDGAGRVMVFGEGNDERSGGSEKGVPAQVEIISDFDKEACRFWWERVPLSEGLGRREEESKARL